MPNADWFTTDKYRAPEPAAKPLEELWKLHVSGRFWTGGLRFQGESYGWEFVLLCDNELFYSRRFPLRQGAEMGADEQRQLVERGFVDTE